MLTVCFSFLSDSAIISIESQRKGGTTVSAKISTQRTYLAIDLKSFYASVECVELKKDPLTTNLVVADASRTEKTICLAVSPSLKANQISGRARLWEVVERVKEVNAERLRKAPGHTFTGSSYDANELAADPSLELSYITAVPRMNFYMDYSTRVVNIYLKHVSFEDLFVYSIDEVFIDATKYLRGRSAHEFAEMLVRDVLSNTGITATAGIGPNMYLAKVAMDVYAKHLPADADGVRIAELDELSYRRILWEHRPLTDFWRVGRGIARKLEENGLFTMGDVALCSIGKETEYYNEELLFRLFGVNAELLIDHAWGVEPTTIQDIRSVKPESKSMSIGQVLSGPYTVEKAKIIIREMTDSLILNLLEKDLVCDQMVLTVGYDTEGTEGYTGPFENDRYGRRVPKMAHGSINLSSKTSSRREIMTKTLELYDRIMNPALLVRRMYVVANHILPAQEAKDDYEQLDLFSLVEEEEQREAIEAQEKEKESRLQNAMLKIQQKHGKNAILHGTSYLEDATGRERNKTVGGHRR